MSWKIVIDKDKCVGCESCVDACPVDVYEMANNKAEVVNGDECIGCESCVEACEEQAITVTEE